MTKFGKVSFAQYLADRGLKTDDASKEAEMTAQAAAEYEAIIMPARSTMYAAGYDLHTPYEVTLKPGEEAWVATGLRVVLENDTFLAIYPRSGLGVRYGIRLKNSVAIIDADYAGAQNEGHLRIAIYNGGTQTVTLEAGKAIAQGIIQKYYTVDDEEVVTQQRTGGFGSTDTKQ